MDITDFYREAPVLTIIFALAYLVILGSFIYLIIKMLRNK